MLIFLLSSDLTYVKLLLVEVGIFKTKMKVKEKGEVYVLRI